MQDEEADVSPGAGPPGDTAAGGGGDSTGSPGDGGRPCSGCTGRYTGCCTRGEGCMTPGDAVVHSSRSSNYGDCKAVARSNSRSCRTAGSVLWCWVPVRGRVVLLVLEQVSEVWEPPA